MKVQGVVLANLEATLVPMVLTIEYDHGHSLELWSQAPHHPSKNLQTSSVLQFKLTGVLLDAVLLRPSEVGSPPLLLRNILYLP
jgi:hypothetical protein